MLLGDVQDDVLGHERLKARRRYGDRIGSGYEVGGDIVACVIRLYNARHPIDAILSNRD